MAGIASLLLLHDYVLLSLDRGSEAVGSGKGKKWAVRRGAFAGRGGYLEQVWGTREALHQPMESKHGSVLGKLMTFLGLPATDQVFVSRPHPIVMDISNPVLRVPMQFVEIILDPVTQKKHKKMIFLNSENHQVSTEQHPFAKLPLMQDGSTDAEWCDKHTFNTVVKMTTKPMKKFFREVMKIIRLIRNRWVWIELSTLSAPVLETKDCRECDEVDQELK